ncbi:MAG TPA: LLM class flavin-dependent oxidoreductase [Baekduia sp.]|nr:LLM class flavin-dependent oxidoreductase [Baekduia sp.]
MEIGVNTFGDFGKDPVTGVDVSPQQRMAHLLEEIELADEVGLDVFGLGEHHRREYLISAPTVVLGAASQRTKRIRLATAVTVLSSDDPVRVWEQFATLDLLSNGRAEILAGRGSFTESFPLFGYDLRDYDELFSEKLELLLALRDAGDEPVSWQGTLRPSLENAVVVPQPVQRPLPIWIAVGGNPESVIRAGALGLPLYIAIIGGMPERFAELVELYREAGRRAEQPPEKLKVAIGSIGFVAGSDENARKRFYPGYAAMMTQIGRERGWGPMTPRGFEALNASRGALLVGNPEQVAEKILFEHSLFDLDRFALQLGAGPVAHADVMHAIELFGTEVAPRVRAELDAPKMVSSGEKAT